MPYFFRTNRTSIRPSSSKSATKVSSGATGVTPVQVPVLTTSPSLESVRRLYEGLQSFRSMMRMDASLRKASALRLRFSQSLANRRQRLSQAIVRSTNDAHRRAFELGI